MSRRFLGLLSQIYCYQSSQGVEVEHRLRDRSYFSAIGGKDAPIARANHDSWRFVEWLGGRCRNRNGGCCIRNGYGRLRPRSRACCGILGLKTTFRLVSLKGVFPLSPDNLDTVGPMAKDIPRLVPGMDLLQEGFAARYKKAVGAKPSTRDIKIGRLYIDGTDQPSTKQWMMLSQRKISGLSNSIEA
jgi:Amidase